MPLPTTLTVGLGFDGELRLHYPNGKTIDLPKGDAEARMREILQGFSRSLREHRQEVSLREYTIPPARMPSGPISLPSLSLSDLDI